MEKCRARKCPVCENEYVDVIKEIHMLLPKEYHLPESYQVVSCENCGFVYADTTATKEDYDHYYENCNWYGTVPEGVHVDRFELVKEFLIDVPKSSNILDIGAGNGLLLTDIGKKNFLNGVGVDPSATSVQVMREKGIKAIQQSVYEEPSKELVGKFDIVFLMCVAEHLYHPREALEQCQKYLKENGVLIIDVPDYSKVSIVNTPIPDQFNQEHINYFSEVSLGNLLGRIDMEKIFTKTFTHYTNGLPQPFLIMSFKKHEFSDRKELLRDNLTEQAVSCYLENQASKLEKLEQQLEEWVENQSPIVVWGTGSYTMNLLATTNLGKCNIQCFIDNNISKIGTEFYHRNIESPNILKQIESPIIICSMLYANQIVKQIHNDLRLNNEIIVL